LAEPTTTVLEALGASGFEPELELDLPLPLPLLEQAATATQATAARPTAVNFL
jgi:hypothetical protein